MQQVFPVPLQFFTSLLSIVFTFSPIQTQQAPEFSFADQAHPNSNRIHKCRQTTVAFGANFRGTNPQEYEYLRFLCSAKTLPMEHQTLAQCCSAKVEGWQVDFFCACCTSKSVNEKGSNLCESYTADNLEAEIQRLLEVTETVCLFVLQCTKQKTG